jgi:uncharacterized protein DUF4239
MARTLLNHLSDWAIGLIFIAISVAIALVALRLVQRFLPGWREAESGEQVVGVGQMVMTIFALVLAFVILNLYNGFQSAAENVSAEANSLSTVMRDAQAFPSADRHRIDHAVAAYAEVVRKREFEQLTQGREDPQARRRLALLISAVQGYSPVTESQRAFYRSLVDELNAVSGERQKRVEAAESSIPGPLLALILVSGAVLLGTSLLIRAHRPAVDIALVASVAVIVGLGLFTAVILQYPFSGSIAVSSSPFAHVQTGV